MTSETPHNVASVTGTYAPTMTQATGVVVSCEYSTCIATGASRAAIAFNQMPDVIRLKALFSEIIVSDVRAELRQDALIGPDSMDLIANGRIYAAVIPSGKNTDAASGTNADKVMSVRRKQAFPLSSVTQSNAVFSFELSGFELDLAQDPRRQQGPVAWLGNTGVQAAKKDEKFSICSVTWYFKCTCSGVAALW